ncbi:hypothetical protein ACLB2K_050901 [Fragaria x ananassa]
MTSNLRITHTFKINYIGEYTKGTSRILLATYELRSHARFSFEKPGAFAHQAFPQNPSATTSVSRQFSTYFNISTSPTYLTTSMASVDAATTSFYGFGYRQDCSFRPMGPIVHCGCMAATVRLQLGPMAPFGPIDD